MNTPTSDAGSMTHIVKYSLDEVRHKPLSDSNPRTLYVESELKAEQGEQTCRNSTTRTPPVFRQVKHNRVSGDCRDSLHTVRTEGISCSASARSGGHLIQNSKCQDVAHAPAYRVQASTGGTFMRHSHVSRCSGFSKGSTVTESLFE